MFCKHCGSLLKPKDVDGKKVLGCSCGYAAKDSDLKSFNITSRTEQEEISVVHNDEPSLHAKTKEICPACGHDEASCRTQQVGPSDEPEDYIYTCTKCGHNWRDGY